MAATVVLCLSTPPIAQTSKEDGAAFSTRTIGRYDEAIRLNPNDAFAFYNRALIYRELGNNDRAIADFKRALDLGIFGARQHLDGLGVAR